VAGSTNSVKIYRIPTVIGNVEILKPSKGYMVGHYLKRLNGIAYYESGKGEKQFFGKGDKEGDCSVRLSGYRSPTTEQL